ncbi:MAG: hypothetical protein R2734_11255 [Nocardioides sp.]
MLELVAHQRITDRTTHSPYRPAAARRRRQVATGLRRLADRLDG